MKKLIKGIKIFLAIFLVFILVIILLFGHSNIPLKELKSKYSNTASSFIFLDGMEIHFRDEGNQTDTIPIVLIHGTASSLHTFDNWADSLKKVRRVIRMDLPGYGLTGPFPNRDYSIKHYTTFLHDFLTSLKINQCVLVGNSLGGQIAWNYCLEKPNFVRELVLIDPAGYPVSSKSVPIAFKLAQIPVLRNVLTYVTPRFLVKASLENVYFNKSKVTESLIDRYFELTLRDGNRQAFVDRLNFNSDNSAYVNIHKIRQPTLILWGANDLLIPVENAYKFHNDLPNDTLVILDNTGHTPMEESPNESLKPLINFLNKWSKNE